jgi:hypothetical protein
LSNLNGHALWIGKFLTEVIARIEPRSQRFGLTSGCFPPLELSFAGGTKAVIRDRQNGGLKLIFTFVEDLNDVPVRRRVHQLHDVLAGLQNFSRDRNWFING